jgi:rubrerythrin
MTQGISLTEANSENSHPDWFSQLLDHQQTETILEVLQSQDVKNSTNENVISETEADKVNAIQEALEAVQGMNENLNSTDIVNQLSLILQLGLYQDPNEDMDKIDPSGTNDYSSVTDDYWSNSAKDNSMISPPSSGPVSPMPSDPNGDDSDFVVVSRVKGGKRLKPPKKSKRISNVPVMERMTEEATEEEQRLLKMAIQKAHNCRSDSDSPMKEPKYECPSCGRIFSRLYNLKSHIRSHQNYRPFKCLLCPASFTRNHDLNRYFLLL